MVHGSLKHSCLTNTDHASKKGGARFHPPNNGQQEYKSPKCTGIPRAGSIRHFLTLLLTSHSTFTFRAKRTPLWCESHRELPGVGSGQSPCTVKWLDASGGSVSLTHRPIVPLIILPQPRKISPSGHRGRGDTCLCYLFWHFRTWWATVKMFLKVSMQGSTTYSCFSLFCRNKESTAWLL